MTANVFQATCTTYPRWDIISLYPQIGMANSMATEHTVHQAFCEVSWFTYTQTLSHNGIGNRELEGGKRFILMG